ncbi:hypothetical protein [Tabrizicola thermarum]|uniref:hypothetical protein n=1 Tax=Tabrizicola thermarum TaxID=2670345 RepID=UPI000FFC3E90|nr:hypothetical protein [Tabrizicola thermarum]
MQQREELDWVAEVLRDVITFLALNDMMESAKMLAIAAAHIEHNLNRPKPASLHKGVELGDAKILAFPVR